MGFFGPLLLLFLNGTIEVVLGFYNYTASSH
jgi:hypothetical protein